MGIFTKYNLLEGRNNMIGGKFYRNTKTKEIVLEEDAEQYALDKLGITVTPKGKNGELTIEQLQNIEETVSWYFDDWDEIEECENEEEDYYAVKDDLMYEDYISRKMEDM
jgi:hypothetical protein